MIIYSTASNLIKYSISEMQMVLNNLFLELYNPPKSCTVKRDLLILVYIILFPHAILKMNTLEL